MDKLEKDISLLDDCIEHWKKNAEAYDEGGHPDFSASACALCREYSKKQGGSCHDCPIYEASGKANCEGTPYDDIVNGETEITEMVEYLQLLQRLLKLRKGGGA